MYLDECTIGCKRCSGGGTIGNENCDECNDGYYEKIDVSKSCSQNPDNYYFDSNDNKYHRCYSTCKTCSEGGSDTLNNCDVCKDGMNSMEITTRKGINAQTIYNCAGGCEEDGYAYKVIILLLNVLHVIQIKYILMDYIVLIVLTMINIINLVNNNV